MRPWHDRDAAPAAKPTRAGSGENLTHTHGDLNDMRVALVLPKHRLAPWHQRLAATLRQRHGVAIFIDDSAPAYPLPLRAWLRVERFVSGERSETAADFDPARFEPEHTLDENVFDAIIDLSERAELRRHAIAILYDGSADSMTLVARLLAGQTPHLSVWRSGAHQGLAASRPEIENKWHVTRGLQRSCGRCIALIERALQGGEHGAAVDALAGLPAAAWGLPAYVGRFAAATAAKVMTRWFLPTDQWCVALRREGGRFVPVADDGRGYYADPFLFCWGGRTFLFVENFRRATGRAVISAAEVVGDALAGAPVKVLERPYHLSYPVILADAGTIYMLPETAENRTVELYRAVEFPWKWKLESVLIEGVALADATPLFHQGRWWMFAAAAAHGTRCDELCIFHSDKLSGPWHAHAANPVNSDCRSARPAGRIVARGDRLFRPAQDCEEGYGAGIVWHEVVELTPTRFREVEVAHIKAPRALGFDGLHTFDQIGGLEVVDFKAARGAVARRKVAPEALRRIASELDRALDHAEARPAAAGSAAAPVARPVKQTFIAGGHAESSFADSEA